MGFFDKKKENDGSRSGIIDYGSEKKEGGHDHRTNKGEDRTPSQKEGDKAKKK